MGERDEAGRRDALDRLLHVVRAASALCHELGVCAIRGEAHDFSGDALVVMSDALDDALVGYLAAQGQDV